MGKAIIAHAIACEGINVADGENVCFANTTEEFVEKIIKLFSNDALRKRMGAKD